MRAVVHKAYIPVQPDAKPRFKCFVTLIRGARVYMRIQTVSQGTKVGSKRGLAVSKSMLS